MDDAASVEDQVERLIAAIIAQEPDWRPAPGAGPSQLQALQDHLAPRLVPHELLAVLRVMNGCTESWPWILIHDAGPLLSCARIIEETEERRRTQDGHPADNYVEDWSPSLVVISSEGWAFSAVLATHEPRARSAVVDLSYGNQDSPVAAASLTALVAASADGWELGLFADPPLPDDAGRADERELVRAWEAIYPSTDGLARGDGITPCLAGQPSWWLRPSRPNRDEPGTERLSDPLYGGLRNYTVSVRVDERDGSWLRVHDTNEPAVLAWTHLPAGLESGRSVAEGDELRVAVMRVQDNERASRPPGVRSDEPILRVVGVFD